MNFEERTSLEIFRFEKPGDTLSGLLAGIDSVEIGGRPTLRYTIHNPELRKSFSVLGTVDLNSKIRKSDEGRFVRIRFEGLEEIPGRKPKKRFLVAAQKD